MRGVADQGRARQARALTLGALASAALFVPAIIPTYHLILLSGGLALGIACLAVNLLLGSAGLVSFGHAAYFGLGAYAGGFLYTLFDFDSMEVYLLAGMLAAGAAAALLGALCVRATRVHFTILTLALAQIVHSLFISGIVFRAAGGVGRGLFLLGGGGLYIPMLVVGGRVLTPKTFPTVMFYLTAVAFALSAWLLHRLTLSPFGRALRATRQNPTRAAFIGIPVRRYQWYAFMISGTITGLAGGLTGVLDRQVTPEQLHWLFSAKLILATVLGGAGYFWGPAVGAGMLVVLREIALRVTDYWGLTLGILLILVTALAPGGVVGVAARLLRMPGPAERPWQQPAPPGKHG
jgi:branched-chain amino acid transport system permease protein